MAHGGQLRVDGVLVDEGYYWTDQTFETGKKYFLMVEPSKVAAHLFALDRQRETEFSIGADGDTLIPLSEKPGHFQRDIQQNFHNSLFAIKADSVANRQEK